MFVFPFKEKITSDYMGPDFVFQVNKKERRPRKDIFGKLIKERW